VTPVKANNDNTSRETILTGTRSMITPSWTGVAEPIMPGLGSARWDCPELASDAPVAPHDRAGARTRGAARRSVPLPTRCRSAHGIEQFFQFGPDAAGVRRFRDVHRFPRAARLGVVEVAPVGRGVVEPAHHS